MNFFDKIFKGKIKIKIGCALAAFFAFIIAIVVAISLVITPIAVTQNVTSNFTNSEQDTENDTKNPVSSFFEKAWNFITFKGYHTNEQVFYNTIADKFYQYREKNVTIDTTLVTSILFYDNSYDPNSDYIFCSEESDEDCVSNNQVDYKKYSDDAAYIIDNMVVYKDSKYSLKSDEEFNEWLKDNYLKDRVARSDEGFLSISSERQDIILSGIVEEIYSKKGLYEYLMSNIGASSDGPGLLAADVTGYRIRAGMPTELGEGAEFYFTSKNRLYSKFLGQCTWYAFGRANEILANAGSDLKWNYAGNANEWYNYNLSLGTNGFKSSRDVPKVGAIIVWGNGTFGHVAIVEKVYDDGKVDYSEANATGCFIDLHDMYGVWPSNEQLFACNEQREPGNTYGFRYRKHIDPHTTPDLQGYIYIVE